MISQGTISKLRVARSAEVVNTEIGNVVVREAPKGVDACALCIFRNCSFGECTLIPCCRFQRPDGKLVYFEGVKE